MEIDIEIVRVGLTYMYPMFAALIVIEFLAARHLYDIKETLSGFVLAAGATLMRLGTKAVEIAAYFFLFYLFEPIREQYLGYSSFGWAWYVWILCLLADDHNFYWHHRLSHNIRLLWAAHLPHHSARTFNLTVSIRNGWFITTYKMIFWMWMPIAGFEPAMIATCLIINSMYQFFLHSQLIPSLGWYERLFNTPYVHQVHHSCNIEYLDKNHGGILLIWDMLYGTYKRPIKGVQCKYGIMHDPDTYNPITHNFFEFMEIWKDLKKSPKLKDKLMYIFGPPGWSHDNSTMTAKELQKAMDNKEEIDLSVQRA